MRNSTMSNHTLSLLKKNGTHPYIAQFDRAWQNLNLWKEDQREKRIREHRNKLLR
jgi:hypothetical protein